MTLATPSWRLSYTSALGRPAILEVEISFMLRTPLWLTAKRDYTDRPIDGRACPPCDPFNECAAVCAGRSGMRIFETCGLQTADIDSGRGRILVRQAKGNKHRDVILSPVMLVSLTYLFPATHHPARRRAGLRLRRRSYWAVGCYRVRRHARSPARHSVMV